MTVKLNTLTTENLASYVVTALLLLHGHMAIYCGAEATVSGQMTLPALHRLEQHVFQIIFPAGHPSMKCVSFKSSFLLILSKKKLTTF
jgi:hypothetical protein